MMAGKNGKIVLTGGPCSGKTTLTEVIERVFPDQVIVVPEAASLLFSGGFPRWEEPLAMDATQRAIYHVQLQLEAAYRAKYPDKVLVLDRATLDGAAYWAAGSDDFFRAMGTSIEAELSRYDKVIYLQSPDRETYLKNKSKNPSRNETWEEAKRLDLETYGLWSRHSQFQLVRNQRNFEKKLTESLDAIAEDMGYEARK